MSGGGEKFKIPAKVCLEAKHFMKDLLVQLDLNGVDITGLDHMGLTLMTWSYHNFVQARKVLQAEGLVVRERDARNTTITKPHPAVKIQYDANAQLRQLLVEYHLTPRSRGRSDASQLDLFKKNPQLEKFKVV